MFSQHNFITVFQFSEDNTSETKTSLGMYIDNQTFQYVLFKAAEPFEMVHVAFDEVCKQENCLAERLEIMLEYFKLTTRNFEKVNLFLGNAPFTLVPKAFHEADKRTMLQFSTGEKNLGITKVYEWNDCNFIYAVNQALLNTFDSFFKNGNIYHIGILSLKIFFSGASANNNNVFLNLQKNYFELIIKNGVELLFYNQFSFTTNEDVLYFTMSALQQWNINPAELTISIAGALPKDDLLFLLLKTYIYKLSFVGDDFKLNQLNLKVPAHYYFTLLNSVKCD
jgi:hypothetical protein